MLYALLLKIVHIVYMIITLKFKKKKMITLIVFLKKPVK